MAPKFGAGGSGSASAEPLIDEVARYDPRGMRIPGTQYPDETERRSQSGLDFDSAFEQDRMSMRAHGSSWRTFLVDSFVLMFGGTQLAYAMGQMGWFWGVFWLSFSAGSTWLSGHVLGALCIETGAATYPELGRACLGRSGEVAAHLCQWFGYYLTGVVQIAFMSASWDQTFRGQAWADGLCQWEWMLISAALLVPFVQVPAFSQFGQLALLATCSSIYMVVIYLAAIAYHGPYSAGTAPAEAWDGAALAWGASLGGGNASLGAPRPHEANHAAQPAAGAAGGAGRGASMPCYDQFTYQGMLAAVSNMAFTFAGHGTFPEQIREMARPTDFGFAFNLLYALAVPFYICCAVFGFYAFGNMASANQVENLRDGLEVRIALYASLVTTFPVIVLGQVVLLLSVEIPLGILPTDWLVNNSAAHLESPTAARLRKFPPVLLRLVFRTAYVGSLLFWAQALVGAGLAFYVNIAGSLGLAAMTYWLPFVLALARTRYAPRADDAPLLDPTAAEGGGEAVERAASVGATLRARNLARFLARAAPSAGEEQAVSCGEAVNAGCAPSRADAASPRGCRALVYALCAFGGVFISATGLWFNLAGLVGEGRFALFHEQSCREGAHFWGDSMWEPALAPNTTAYQTLVIGCCQNGTTCGS